MTGWSQKWTGISAAHGDSRSRVPAPPMTAPLPSSGPSDPGPPLSRAWGRLSWIYYQYLLVTALYMLEPWERTVFNSMLVSVVGMALYTGYVFMPQHIMAILHYFEIMQ